MNDGPEISGESGASASQFMTLFTHNSRKIYLYIYTLLPNRSDAEDVFQSTSITLWEKFNEFDQERSFYAWACGVAFYKVKNFRRVASRSHLAFSSELVASLAIERKENSQRSDQRIDAMKDCLEKLPKDDRLMIRQVYGHPEEHRETSPIHELAAQRGRAVQTIYNRLNLIRRKLVRCIDQTMQAEGAGA